MNSIKSLRRRLSSPKIHDNVNAFSQKHANGGQRSRDGGSKSGQGYSVATPLKQVANPQKKIELLLQKIELCKVHVDFTSSLPQDTRLKEVKRQTLLELVDFLNSSYSSNSSGNAGVSAFSEPHLKTMIAMVSANLFTGLPPRTRDFDPEEDDPYLEPTWPHKQVVYEFLLRLIVTPDVNAKVAKHRGMIDHDFCLGLIELFDSEDPRERDYLKTILHRVYGKFMSHRAFIRRQIGYVFADFVTRTQRHNGIGELLEILGSIINGFALPLKPEHVAFIKNSLIPLHKIKCYSQYQQQLTYCITQYIEKDVQMGLLVVRKLTEYWPWSSSSKQFLFLNELEEVIEYLPHDIVDQVKQELFGTIARCIRSRHFQVAERTLFLWNNDKLVTTGCLNKEYAQTVLPIVYPALLNNLDPEGAHWNPTVKSLTQNVIDLYKDLLTSKQFENYTKGCSASTTGEGERRIQRWQNLAETLAED